MYMHDSKPQTESTIFYETCYHHHHRQVNEEGHEEEYEEEHGLQRFGHIRELYLEGEELDHALSLPWHEHRVLFNQKVDVGSVALFAAGVIHRGPAVCQTGLRFVLFQPCVAGNIHIRPDDYENLVYEFTYADYRYNSHLDGRRYRPDLLAESLYRYRDEWSKHVTSEQQRKNYSSLQRMHEKRGKQQQQQQSRITLHTKTKRKSLQFETDG
jgi:hypothetical protein